MTPRNPFGREECNTQDMAAPYVPYVEITVTVLGITARQTGGVPLSSLTAF